MHFLLQGRLITGEEHTRPFRGGILTFEGDNTKYILVPDDVCTGGCHYTILF